MSAGEDENSKPVNYCSAITGLGLGLGYFSIGSEELNWATHRNWQTQLPYLIEGGELS